VRVQGLIALAAVAALLAVAPAARAVDARPIGNDDWIVVWTVAETQALDPDASIPKFKKGLCFGIRKIPGAVQLRAACKAKWAKDAISKGQLHWLFNRARANGGCALAVFDWGRHPVKKSWKVRNATGWSDGWGTGGAWPWVQPGRTDPIERSDTDDYPQLVTCT
jgi:hypothetical protein